MTAADAAKSLVKKMGLLRAALFVCDQYFKVSPFRVCRRSGITYSLDCRELIDRDIFLGAWERSTTRFIEEYVHPGAVVMEVGANIGAHTLLLAQHVGLGGHVYAFEPTEFARAKLCRNIALNPDLAPRITVISALVTEKSHAAPRRIIRSSWRLDSAEQAPNEVVTCEAVSLDEFLLTHSIARVDVVKIDVDGYDCKVLRGATELLKNWHPVVYVELCEYALREQGDSIQSIFDLLQSLGYSAKGETGMPFPSATAVLEIVGDSSSTNALFTAPAVAG